MGDQGNTPPLQRVRCGHCRLPLVQIYQGDLLYTLQRNEEEIASQLPAYSYRLLTDPKPLLFCPRCHAPLSPATVTVVVVPRTVVTEENNIVPHTGNL